MKVFFRKVFAVIIAFIVFALITQALRFVAPVVIGLLFMSFGAPSHEFIDPKTLEAIGNILNFIFSVYFSIKVYKKIA